ncbi:MAG TPA: protease modulator HflC [Candidatus Fimimorpha faecalis]|uniref:Protein HflC n=1 Tax=Candidatus Fimimorpha faecalis TaxID=2840824 RepID=A0A9D1ECU1_9FIRM|nr:protease modulator HflC [Candidatus Fimimorpha faecalis]
MKRVGKIIAVIAVIAVVMTVVSSTFITKEDEYKLIRQFGKVDRVVSEAGIGFKMPFVEEIDTLPKQILLYDLPASDVITKDKKTMIADSYVLWKIVDPLKFAQTLNSSIGNAESRINTVVYNSIKNVISSLSQTEVISGRDGELADTIMNNIGTTMDQYGISLLSVETKRLDLPSDNKTAVYERMISERNKIAAQYTAEGDSEATVQKNSTDKEVSIMLSNAEAEAAAVVAQAEAEYMKILANAYSDADRRSFYEFIRSLDAAKASLKDGDKTLILPKESPIAQIFIGE